MQYTTNLNLKKPALTDVADVQVLNDNWDTLDTEVNNKTDKIAGKGLSTNDYTTAEKNKLAGLSNYDSTNVDAHMANVSNPHSVTAAQVGLGSVQNYGIATQVEAEAGTSDVKHMTPLKVKQSINSEVTTTGAANKIVKATADGDVVASRYLKVGSNYIRYNNGQLEVSSNLTNWEVVGVPRYSNFNQIAYKGSIVTGQTSTIAVYTGAGKITEIIIGNEQTVNLQYNILYNIDGGGDVVVSPTASSTTLANRAMGLNHNISGESGGLIPAAKAIDIRNLDLFFNTSFEIKIARFSLGSHSANFECAVRYMHE